MDPLPTEGFPGGSDNKESPYNTGDPGLIPRLGRPPGEGNGSPLQYSCLENPMDRETWQATVNGPARIEHDLATKPPPPNSVNTGNTIAHKFSSD